VASEESNGGEGIRKMMGSQSDFLQQSIFTKCDWVVCTSYLYSIADHQIKEYFALALSQRS